MKNEITESGCLIEAEELIQWLEDHKNIVYQTLEDADGLGDPNTLSQHVALGFGMQRAYDLVIRHLRRMQGRVDE